MSNSNFYLIIMMMCVVHLHQCWNLAKLRAEFETETIIQEKHIPSYIDADCILQIMEDE